MRRTLGQGFVGLENSLDLLGGTDDVVGPETEDRRLLGPKLTTDRRLDTYPMAVECLVYLAVAILAELRVIL